MFSFCFLSQNIAIIIPYESYDYMGTRDPKFNFMVSCFTACIYKAFSQDYRS